MTKKSWKEFAWIGCCLCALSAPCWADDAPALKRLKDLAGPETPLSAMKDASPRPVLINDDNGNDSAPVEGQGQGGIAYKKLWGVRNFIEIIDVKFVAVTSMYWKDPNYDPDLDSAGIGSCVKLALTAKLGASNNLLETWSSSDGQDSVSFHDMRQGHAGWPQFARMVPIEYFWIPVNEKLKDGESAPVTVRFPLSDPKKGSVKGYFEVSATATGRSRRFPGMPTASRYLDISDVQVRQVHN